MSPKTEQDTLNFISMVAIKQGWKLTRDTELLELLIEGLTKNFNRYGYYSCPCRGGKADKERDRDIICPCKYSWPDIAEYGHCYCGLYMSGDFFESGKVSASIPERRPHSVPRSDN